MHPSSSIPCIVVAEIVSEYAIICLSSKCLCVYDNNEYEQEGDTLFSLLDGFVIFPAQNWIEEGSNQSVRDNVVFFVFWKSGRLGISEWKQLKEEREGNNVCNPS